MLMAQNAFAGDYNPFLGTASKDSPVQKPSSKTAKLPDAIPAPLPALPTYAPGYRGPGAPNGPGQIGLDLPKEAPKPSYMASGRIGDQVVLIDHSGARVIVQDGTMKAGCFVRYPDIICDKDDMAQAKREFVAQARAREEEEITVATQKAKIVELSETVAKMREGMNASAQEVIAARSVKAELSKVKTQDLGLQQQLTAAKADLNRQVAGIAELAKVQEEAALNRVSAADLRKKLEAMQVHATKADMELASLKASAAAPPRWVKGSSKVYKDSILGEVKVSHDAGQVFFCIAGKEEDSADHFFGKNVLRKERKGSYVYYALNSSSVRVKE